MPPNECLQVVILVYVSIAFPCLCGFHLEPMQKNPNSSPPKKNPTSIYVPEMKRCAVGKELELSEIIGQWLRLGTEKKAENENR